MAKTKHKERVKASDVREREREPASGARLGETQSQQWPTHSACGRHDMLPNSQVAAKVSKPCSLHYANAIREPAEIIESRNQRTKPLT